MPAGRPDPYGSNNYGVQVKPLDFSHERSPMSKVYHGLTIVAQNNIVGRLTSWNPSLYKRDVQHQFELSYITWGRPVDIVPGKMNGAYTITATSLEMWDKEIDRRLTGESTVIFNDLQDQVYPLEIHEHWFKGGASGSWTTYRHWGYFGVWLTDMDPESYSADASDGGRVQANANMTFVSRQLLS